MAVQYMGENIYLSATRIVRTEILFNSFVYFSFMMNTMWNFSKF